MKNKMQVSDPRQWGSTIILWADGYRGPMGELILGSRQNYVQKIKFIQKEPGQCRVHSPRVYLLLWAGGQWRERPLGGGGLPRLPPNSLEL